MSITDFLNARIAEDEEQAETCRKLGWFPASKYEMHAVSHARVLAECAAKRAIVSLAGDVDAMDYRIASEWGGGLDGTADDIFRTLAAVYADHPAYRDEWRVGA